MSFANFYFAKVPPIYFGAGQLSKLPRLLADRQCQRILLVTGGCSLELSGHLDKIRQRLEEEAISFVQIRCLDEPTPDFIDSVCDQYRASALRAANSQAADPKAIDIQAVVAIGGGSVIDAGKAISAMLPHNNSILDHLEGVGPGLPHSGLKLPFIAVPTTSGTGSEVTKNAVISQVGPNGFKKSIRHDNFIPDAVIIDSELLLSCPSTVTAACGMDAFTQLIEPYLSPTATPLTDALAWSGLEALAPNLLAACSEGAQALAVREAVAYGALMSGICLANAGLGIVHGLASPLGAHYPIPHGVVCATLMAAALEANWNALRARAPESPALAKIARLGTLLRSRGRGATIDPRATVSGPADGEALIEILKEWTEQLKIPRLGEYGISADSLDALVSQASNRNNPIELSQGEIKEILLSRL